WWAGFALVGLFSQPPSPLTYRLGNAIGRLAMRFMKRRAKIAYRNLELCFPEKSGPERTPMVGRALESGGVGRSGEGGVG
ncbi:hypothetical protein M8371_33285, partial [Klebsiella pneumoniae]|nr:hypothetical protein [Klebsiella pneumoniae]